MKIAYRPRGKKYEEFKIGAEIGCSGGGDRSVHRHGLVDQATTSSQGLETKLRKGDQLVIKMNWRSDG